MYPKTGGEGDDYTSMTPSPPKIKTLRGPCFIHFAAGFSEFQSGCLSKVSPDYFRV